MIRLADGNWLGSLNNPFWVSAGKHPEQHFGKPPPTLLISGSAALGRKFISARPRRRFRGGSALVYERCVGKAWGSKKSAQSSQKKKKEKKSKLGDLTLTQHGS